MERKRSFAAIADPNARILILGTMPGEESLRKSEYYAHPRNGFWPIMCMLFGGAPDSSYAERRALLLRNKIAVWDVLEHCERPGSLDSSIRNEKPNRLDEFFTRHSDVRLVVFNGRKAEALYRRYVAKDPELRNEKLRFVTLPSTSPAHTLAFEKKLAAWRAGLRGP